MDDKDAMVRMRYVGQQGELDHPRLAGLSHIGPGHAVDMPRGLAEKLVAQGLFVFEVDYDPEQSGGEDLNVGEPESADMASEGAEDVKTFVEITEEPARVAGYRPPALGTLPGLGMARLDALVQADVTDWEDLAALDDDECESLAAKMKGVSADQVRQWRDTAQAVLAG